MLTTHKRKIALFGCILVLGIFFPSFAARPATGDSGRRIVYLSVDLSSAIVFSSGRVRFGPFLVISDGAATPASAAEYLEPGEGVQCISIGPKANTVEFAIKRPIKAGERFGCVAANFRVARCFENCRNAVIEVDTPVGASKQGALRSYLYVDACLGVLAYSQTEDFSHGIPVNAAWLRGEVGILADKGYPACRSF